MHSEQKIVLIGTGKLAEIIGFALYQAGFNLVQVYGRDQVKANKLANAFKAKAVGSVDEIRKDADLYLIAVSDDAISQIALALKGINGICVHTSGSVNMDVFDQTSDGFGVFYPLQTFSEGRNIQLNQIPILIEGNNSVTTDRLFQIAETISEKVVYCNSEERKTVHLSAVFVSNFVNAMLGMGEELISQTSLSFEILYPLIRETVDKAIVNGVKRSQTGPAVRGDIQTMKEHLRLLENRPDLAILYEHISAIIVKANN